MVQHPSFMFHHSTIHIGVLQRLLLRCVASAMRQMEGEA